MFFVKIFSIYMDMWQKASIPCLIKEALIHSGESYLL